MEHKVKGGRRQLVLAAKKEDVIAVGQSQRFFQSAVDSFLLTPVANLDSTIPPRQPVENAARLVRDHRIREEKKLPIRIELRADGLDRLS